MSVRRLVKKMAWAVLPEPIIRSIKRRHYVRLVSASGPHQEPDLRIASLLVNPGSVAVDIGANIGVYTRALSQLVGSNGRVYSVEPFPSTFDILRHTVGKLGLGNVELMNVALSDAETIVAMEMPSDSSGAETHYRAHIVAGDTGTGSSSSTGIRATTLDAALAKTAPHVSFVKCDVEGHELACLRGAAGFLERSEAAWLIEISGDPDDDASSAHAVFELLRAHGFTAWWLDGDSLRQRRGGDTSINYFFLKPGHLTTLRERGITLAAG